MAFHPDFARNGKFYTAHTEAFAALKTKTPGPAPQPNTVVHSVLTEWTATNPAADTFSGTRREMLRLGFASYIHAHPADRLQPDGQAGRRATTGCSTSRSATAASAYREHRPAEPARCRTARSCGSTRAAPTAPTASTASRATNPFVGRPSALGEIYALGMRDPHRFSWDTGRGNRMFLGHIGEHDIEAIYDVRAGDNFGWSEREGPFVFKQADRCNLYPLPADDAQFGYTYPVAAYDHDPPAGYPCTPRQSGTRSSAASSTAARRSRRCAASTCSATSSTAGSSTPTPTRCAAGGKLRHDLRAQGLQRRRAAGSRCRTSPATPGSTCGSARDGAGELYLLAKANGKIWKVTGTRRRRRDCRTCSRACSATSSPSTTSSTRSPPQRARSSSTRAPPARTSTWSTAARRCGSRDGAYPGSTSVAAAAAGQPDRRRQRRLEGRHLLGDRRADA